MHFIIRFPLFPGRAGCALGICLLVLTGAMLTGCLADSRVDPGPVPTVQSTPTEVALATTIPGNTGALAKVNTPSPTEDPPSPTATINTQHPLAGRRIGLDPGHGPRDDLGAVLVDKSTGKLILSEAELNLDVALRCRDILVARGATVMMTRETADKFTVPWTPDTNGDGTPGTEADDLQHRIDILNDFHAEVFLSIHANSSGNPAMRQGMQALYCGAPDCAFPQQNKRLGSIVLDHLSKGLAGAGYPAKRSELRNDLWSDVPGEPPTHLFMLGPANPPRHVRAITMPGIVIEAMYVTSPEEAAQLKKDSIRQAIAQSYADALQEFLTTKP